MSSPISNFIQTYLGVAQLGMQRQQLQQQEERDRVAALQNFQNIARNTADPFMLQGLADTYAKMGIADHGTLTELLRQTAPTADAITNTAARRGLADMQGFGGQPAGQMTGEQQSYDNAAALSLLGMQPGQYAAQQLTAEAFAGRAGTPDQQAQLRSRTLTGMDSGAAALSTAAAGLPQGELSQAAAIGLQTRPSAQNVLANELGWATYRGNMMEMLQRGALGEAELSLRNRELAGKGGGDMPSFDGVTSLLENKRQLVNALGAMKDNPTPALLQSYIGALNGVNSMLRAFGLPTEDEIPYDPELLTRPEGLAKLLQTIGMGGPATRGVPQRVAPTPPFRPPQPGVRPDTTGYVGRGGGTSW